LATALLAAATAPVLDAGVTRRLQQRYAVVLTAVEQAHERVAARDPRWWGRRVGFASASAPLGAVALAICAGVSGTAAASIAVGGEANIPGRLADFVTPGWAKSHDNGGGAGVPASPRQQSTSLAT